MSRIVRSTGLSSRIGLMMQRRQQGEASLTVSKVSVKSGGVVTLDPEFTPIVDILGKARKLGRPARQTEYLHVSDLIGKCIRRIALYESMQLGPKPQGLSLTQSLTFAQGDAIHDVLKDRVASGAPQQVWGRWTCRCKTTTTEAPCLFSEVDPKRSCPACHQPLDVYVEVPTRSDKYMVVGTPDLLTLLTEHQALYISELKSISHDQWKVLSRPDPDHVIQVLFYWLLMRDAGYRLANRVSIVYATKGYLFTGSPIKEFTLDASTMMPRLDVYLRYAEQIIETRKGGNLPARLDACLNDHSPEAKKCDVCHSCFGVQSEKPVSVSIASALSRRPRR